ncbi:MAG: PDZ domain-containing protein [Chloroflexi bacterium]|nr:PDZ domain-containing protein [Chloroflexota bacterium]
MTKRKGFAVVATLLLMAAVGIGLTQPLDWGTASGLASSTARTISRADLGIVYVPVTAKTAPYYGLGIDHGALVTEVVPNSPADRAGLQPGDVIVAFNGTVLREGVSLARLIIDCTAGHGESAHQVMIEVWIGGCVHLLQLTHSSGRLSWR